MRRTNHDATGKRLSPQNSGSIINQPSPSRSIVGRANLTWLVGVLILGLSLTATVPQSATVSRDAPIVLDGFTGSLVDVPGANTSGLQHVPSTAQPEYAALATEVSRRFPQGDEVFLALYGNPAFTTGSRLLQYSPAALGLAFSQGAAPGMQADAKFNARTNGFSRPAGTVILEGQSYSLTDQIFTSPLILDLKGDGVFTPAAGRFAPHPGKANGPFALFDIDGDGFDDVTEWAGRGYGFLTTSPNPTNGRDLVGSPGGWRDGFTHLAERFDRNRDGRVQGRELNSLYVFEDANGNGRAEPGEVMAASDRGIEWIETAHSDFLGRYGDSTGRTPAVWDFWPSYSHTNRITTDAPEPASDISIKRSGSFCSSGRDNHEKHLHSLSAESLNGSVAISHAKLIKLGIDPTRFELWTVARGGSLIVGSDKAGLPERARVWAIDLHGDGRIARVRSFFLPFEQIFQVALTPRADRALVLGDNGANLVIANIEAGSVSPQSELSLRKQGLRASGVAGYNGGFWFTAWRLDANLAVREHRVYALDCGKIRAGLSLDTIQQEIGSLVSHYITGPDSGFFATLATDGNEHLWQVDGSSRTLVAVADAFGGIAAVGNDAVYSARIGSDYVLGLWRDGAYFELARGAQPIFYPFLTRDRASVIAATLSPGTLEIEYLIASERNSWATRPLLRAFPGSGKVSRGVLAHSDPTGLRLVPFPTSPEKSRKVNLETIFKAPRSE